jgi:hypothetical protein
MRPGARSVWYARAIHVDRMHAAGNERLCRVNRARNLSGWSALPRIPLRAAPVRAKAVIPAYISPACTWSIMHMVDNANIAAVVAVGPRAAESGSRLTIADDAAINVEQVLDVSLAGSRRARRNPVHAAFV